MKDKNSNRQNNAETIEIISEQSINHMLWEPIVGSEFLNLVNYKDIPEESKASLAEETRRILGKCVSPTLNIGAKTGLVIGYVQSGKTLSFTAVSAMAKDNGYPILIVISGISVPLSGQSKTRLQEDLRFNERSDRVWLSFNNPSSWSDEEAIRRIIEDWKDSSVQNKDCQTILITVMKNHKHLKNLIEVFKKLDLSELPVLIIDDEADQASLNTKAKKDGEESTTYSRIAELRKHIPKHTFLQYTATPQAPLLISIIDTLSPDFAEILTPGPDYIGGKQFFGKYRELVRTIPDSETLDSENHEPPESLILALKIFFLGVVSAMVLAQDRKGNRSMLVHPSRETIGHQQFIQWVYEIQKRFQQEFSLPDNDPDKKALIEEFNEAYKDLAKTVESLPSFDNLIEKLPLAIRRTRIEEVNASRGKTPTIDWKGSYSYILVGGQAMDRGFTVEGLTVTYMPRSTGVRNADVLQQRARFLGYKRSYLGYCRVFLEHNMRKALEGYIDLEEDIQNQLREYSNTGKPLSEWKRVFQVPEDLHPTRGNILKYGYTRGNFSDEWYAPNIASGPDDSEELNRKIIDTFITRTEWASDEGHPNRTLPQKHLVNKNLLLKAVYENLLRPFAITDPNSLEKYEGLLLQLRKHLELFPEETCTLYIMSQESSTADWLTRERSVGGELFQGANPDKSGEFYPGDRNIGDKRQIVIQLHRLKIINPDKSVAGDDIRFVAIRVPDKMSKSWLSQIQVK